MGQAEDKCRLIGESYDEDKMLPIHLEANAQNICHYLYFYKIFLGYLFQDYQQALKYTRLVEESQDSAVGSIPLADFYISLISWVNYHFCKLIIIQIASPHLLLSLSKRFSEVGDYAT